MKLVRKIKNRTIQKVRSIFTKKTHNLQLRMVIDLRNQDLKSDLIISHSYYIAPYFQDMDDQWLEFLNNSGQFGRWSENKLHQVITDKVIPEGVVLIMYKNKIVGCGALCQFNKYSRNLTLMYMLVDEAHRGQKIGKYILTNLISRAKIQGFNKIFLATDDNRVEAINLYLKTGFRPDLKYTRDATERWNNIFKGS